MQEPRAATAGEIARDFVVAIIGRSSEYNPGSISERNSRNQIELVTKIYETIFKRVKEIGTV